MLFLFLFSIKKHEYYVLSVHRSTLFNLLKIDFFVIIGLLFYSLLYEIEKSDNKGEDITAEKVCWNYED